MSKTIKIKSKLNFVKNFLSPISKISDASILEVNADKLSCLTCTSDNSIYIHVEYPIESEFVDIKTLNCPDIKKLIKAFDTIATDDVSFELEENNLSYKDSGIRFKYHLQEDGIIKSPKMSLNRLRDTEFQSSFSIKKQTIRDLIKGSVFSSESNKIYLFGNSNDGIHGELTDKTRNNIDTITLRISESFFGDPVDSLPLNFEIFRIMDISNIDEIKVKINVKIGVVLFEIENNYNKMKYIMSSLIK
jgi:hypothetical protein